MNETPPGSIVESLTTSEPVGYLAAVAFMQARAEAIAREELKVVVQTMRLEDQEVDAQATKRQFEHLVEEMVRTPQRLWR